MAPTLAGLLILQRTETPPRRLLPPMGVIPRSSCCLISPVARYTNHPAVLFLTDLTPSPALRLTSPVDTLHGPPGCLVFCKGHNIRTDALPYFSKDRIHSHPWPSFSSGPDTPVFISQPFLLPPPPVSQAPQTGTLQLQHLPESTGVSPPASPSSGPSAGLFPPSLSDEGALSPGTQKHTGACAGTCAGTRRDLPEPSLSHGALGCALGAPSPWEACAGHTGSPGVCVGPLGVSL